MCCGSRKSDIPPNYAQAEPPPPPPTHQYDYGDMPSPLVPAGYNFDPYSSHLDPVEIYVAGVFLAQIVNGTARPQSNHPFQPLMVLSSLIFPDWVPEQICSAVYAALPPTLLKPDGVPLIMQMPVEFAEQLRERQVQEPSREEPGLLYFGWGPMRYPSHPVEA
ncbi:uncharacterized protein I303_105069 [Kwoniella dejecticola CBS 10117]|uniref:Uncharacterized protein n=1 Tax=Kwoniella dejecticola CBS 10117 TaxID=1296121 RepID=A0A1A6A3J5_9TREE|nr:uncharacterized protein I303_05485 [Kwoniella dejecticola CBS 10117]OBR84626.1 hypothetical protein I303_05485 [Kwoniella dejecticola CBS 10117]